MITSADIVTAAALYLAARQDYQRMEFEEGFVWTIVFIALAANGVVYYLNPTHLLAIATITALAFGLYHLGWWADGDAMMLIALSFVHAEWDFWARFYLAFPIAYILLLASIYQDKKDLRAVLFEPHPMLPVLFLAYVMAVGLRFFKI